MGQNCPLFLIEALTVMGTTCRNPVFCLDLELNLLVHPGLIGRRNVLGAVLFM